jgi:hypothetical protein
MGSSDETGASVEVVVVSIEAEETAMLEGAEVGITVGTVVVATSSSSSSSSSHQGSSSQGTVGRVGAEAAGVKVVSMVAVMLIVVSGTAMGVEVSEETASRVVVTATEETS